MYGVVIRTNGGTLSIDAENDIVNHYGDTVSLYVKAVDLEQSYHEFGKVGFAKIEKGHFVAEANSKIVLLLNKGEENVVKLDKATTATVEQAYSTVESSQEVAHGGNLSLIYNADYADENNTELKDLIYHAEATVENAILVDEHYYKTIGDAFSKAPLTNGNGFDISNAHKITLLKDIEGSGLWINQDNANIEIDFNGHTYCVTSAVGSTGTTTQAMHFEGSDTKVVLKNGTFTTKVGIPKILMALQNYVEFKAENMTFDLSKIPVLCYGENEFSGIYEKFNGHEVSTFNNNTDKQMVLTNCHLIFPEESKYSISIGSSIKIINSIIDGYISFSKGETVMVDGTSSIKGMNTYFEGDGKVVSNTTTNPGFTTYTWSEN